MPLSQQQRVVARSQYERTQDTQPGSEVHSTTGLYYIPTRMLNLDAAGFAKATSSTSRKLCARRESVIVAFLHLDIYLIYKATRNDPCSSPQS